jgi:hypothetical protein
MAWGKTDSHTFFTTDDRSDCSNGFAQLGYLSVMDDGPMGFTDGAENERRLGT